MKTKKTMKTAEEIQKEYLEEQWLLATREDITPKVVIPAPSPNRKPKPLLKEEIERRAKELKRSQRKTRKNFHKLMSTPRMSRKKERKLRKKLQNLRKIENPSPADKDRMRSLLDFFARHGIMSP